MNTPESTASAEPFTATTVINRAVKEKTDGGKETSAGDIAETLEKGSELLPEEEQAKVEQYIVGIQTLERDTIIKNLDPKLGGLYNGSERFVSASILKAEDRDPMEAIEQGQEADDHEKLHETGDHTGAYTMYEDEQGNSQYLVLGGVELDLMPLQEGSVVDRTGDKFVSDQYRSFRDQYLAAVSNSGLSKATVEHALDDTHDLSAIDDRTRAEEGEIELSPEEIKPALEGAEAIAL